MEHRDAIEENRRRMQDYVRAKGVGTAEELISNTDFPSSEWHRIVVDSGKAGAGSGGAPPIAAGLNTLANVFEKLESLMKSDETDGSQVKDLLRQANDNLDGTVDSTKEKLEVLSKQLDTGTIGGQATSMNRKELLSSIAEIAQELMQPLTAINASVEMMLGGYVGEVNPEQRPILDLANNSGAHLVFLMKELIEIVGCPANKGVDDRFHTTSDQVVLMEQKTGQVALPFPNPAGLAN
jgi:signal transduction histidine kinase